MEVETIQLEPEVQTTDMTTDFLVEESIVVTDFTSEVVSQPHEVVITQGDSVQIEATPSSITTMESTLTVETVDLAPVTTQVVVEPTVEEVIHVEEEIIVEEHTVTLDSQEEVTVSKTQVIEPTTVVETDDEIIEVDTVQTTTVTTHKPITDES
mmetsp:Transcript_9810/g.9625  ORF Transcript_9810/g.9625 Transcript_9810/m.9625 type:complete len:154 (-) Transcript_9810:1733-2194(-)